MTFIITNQVSKTVVVCGAIAERSPEDNADNRVSHFPPPKAAATLKQQTPASSS